MNFYNDNDPANCAWMQELIERGHIPPGVVDSRSIKEIEPDELAQYIQCHFFAGIGGWSLALALAGWPADRPVWTGSCPCQPFSDAGKKEGVADPRHLWPWWRELIRVRRPSVIFGEQVASAAAREWLAGVFLDVEGMAYRRAGSDLCAAGIGAPHIRQRIYWVADTRRDGCRKEGKNHPATGSHGALRNGLASGLAHAEDAHGRTKLQAQGTRGRRRGSSGNGTPFLVGMGDTARGGFEGFGGEGQTGAAESRSTRSWDDFELLPCRDGKARRIEPGTFPLAHGIPARVGRLRGYGNAIVPELAAEFIQAYCETLAG